ncbi:MAG: polysaccharide biosynthesis/export family protein [Tateyamaria sp.]
MKNLITSCLAIVLAYVVAVTAVSAQGNYAVQPGDTLRIEVLEDTSLNRNALVLPDGRFSFPFAGTVQAGGRTLSQVERAITSAISSNFAGEPNVFVSVLRVEGPGLLGTEAAALGPDAINVYFIGEIGSPGLRAVMSGTTFLQGLSQSGGFTNFAATKRIQLRRTDPVTGAPSVVNINYKALTRGANFQQNVILQEGDVILVPERRLFE